MKIIGLTGGIASGKSTVARMIQNLGISLICADSLAHEALKPPNPSYKRVVESFGPEILDIDGSINRKKLGEKVFRNPHQRESLEEIIHPWVTDQIKREIKDHKARGTPLLFLDVPLLFESGLDRLCDHTVVVDVPVKILKKRLASRDPLKPREIDQRLASQMSLEEKKKRADSIIDNSGTKAKTLIQVEALIAKLAQR